MDGKCYKETGVIDTDELLCNEEFKLEGSKCILTEEINAIPNKYNCTTGELVKASDYALSPKDTDNAEYVCIDKSSAKQPVLRCLYNSGHIMIDGKCYNGPAPLINGGCPGADKAISRRLNLSFCLSCRTVAVPASCRKNTGSRRTCKNL